MRFRFRDYLYPSMVLKYHHLMQNAPLWSHDHLEGWVRTRRKAILLHAYHRVPYYQRLLDRCGISPEQGDRTEVWRSIPTLDKETIRNNPNALIADGQPPSGSVWSSTSGSTGMKLQVLLDGNVNAAAFSLFWRAWSTGRYWRLGQRHAVMKGFYDPRGWCYRRAIRALELSCFRMNLEDVEAFRNQIESYKPRFIRGYPSALYLFCRLLRQRRVSLHIPMVISGSETLYDFQRLEIESFLGARIYNHYTHWERAASIMECDLGQLHAQEDFGHHEILDSEGQPVPPGVPGEITVTGLHNLAMPLIRYRTGDIGVWSANECSCGQSFPVVETIEGRESDYIISSDGTAIPVTSVLAIAKNLNHLVYMQIIQEVLGRLEIRIVKADGYRHPGDTQDILNRLRQRLGEQVKCEIRFCTVEQLEHTPAGKIRRCFNRIPKQYRLSCQTPEIHA